MTPQEILEGNKLIAEEFIKKLKASGGYLMRKIKTADGKTMVYYREYGSYPTDIKTKIF